MENSECAPSPGALLIPPIEPPIQGQGHSIFPALTLRQRTVDSGGAGDSAGGGIADSNRGETEAASATTTTPVDTGTAVGLATDLATSEFLMELPQPARNAPLMGSIDVHPNFVDPSHFGLIDGNGASRSAPRQRRRGELAVPLEDAGHYAPLLDVLEFFDPLISVDNGFDQYSDGVYNSDSYNNSNNSNNSNVAVPSVIVPSDGYIPMTVNFAGISRYSQDELDEEEEEEEERPGLQRSGFHDPSFEADDMIAERPRQHSGQYTIDRRRRDRDRNRNRNLIRQRYGSGSGSGPCCSQCRSSSNSNSSNNNGNNDNDDSRNISQSSGRAAGGAPAIADGGAPSDWQQQQQCRRPDCACHQGRGNNRTIRRQRRQPLRWRSGSVLGPPAAGEGKIRIRL